MCLSITSHGRLHWALLVALLLEVRLYLQGSGSELWEHFQNLAGFRPHERPDLTARCLLGLVDLAM